MQKLSVFDLISLILLIIGGLNWGLVGLANFDLVKLITFNVGWLASVVYVVVGLSAVYVAIIASKLEKKA